MTHEAFFEHTDRERVLGDADPSRRRETAPLRAPSPLRPPAPPGPRPGLEVAPAPREPLRANPTDPILSRLANSGWFFLSALISSRT
jgi:hypothetical protein